MVWRRQSSDTAVSGTRQLIMAPINHTPLSFSFLHPPHHRLTRPVCSPTAVVTWCIPPPVTVFQSPGDSGSSMSPLFASSHFPSPYFHRRTPDTTATLSRFRPSLDSYMYVQRMQPPSPHHYRGNRFLVPRGRSPHAQNSLPLLSRINNFRGLPLHRARTRSFIA